MNVNFRFMDNNEWTTYATLQSIVALLILTPFLDTSLKVLTLATLLGMMQGKTLHRLIFTGFICILLFRESYSLWTNSIIVLLTSYILCIIPKKNPIYNMFSKNKLLNKILWFGIYVWVLYFAFKLVPLQHLL